MFPECEYRRYVPREFSRIEFINQQFLEFEMSNQYLDFVFWEWVNTGVWVI